MLSRYGDSRVDSKTHGRPGTHAKAVHEWTGRGGLAPLRRRIDDW
jgi:hypothetical protein